MPFFLLIFILPRGLISLAVLFFPRLCSTARYDRSVTFSGYVLRPWLWQLLNVCSPQQQLVGVPCILTVSTIMREKRKWASLSNKIVAIWRFFMKDICVDIVHMFLKFCCTYCCLLKTYNACSTYLYVTLFSLQPYEFWFWTAQSWSFWIMLFSISISFSLHGIGLEINDGEIMERKTGTYDDRWWVLV